ncbi:hypothetical protein [Paenibacillus sp. Soil787]|uniref:hypothetical protein n=1 Tax=Paenibacillus sp. Soil787 TaxID=1736411 RepID=UPI0006F5A52C|nr:hypothetical protein [Paenibacillus sp. Soil787]KRF31708.1 hypothetical protein ASG93_05055 [Paenibacillus sp. Soil787]
MSRSRFVENVEYSIQELDYSKWPTVYLEKHNKTFENRKKAVELYLDNEVTLEEIKNLTGVSRKELRKFVKKCLERDNEGSLWGFRALLGYKRTGETYLRISETDGFGKSKLTGAFKKLLEQYPNIEVMIKNYILNRRKRAAVDKFIRVKDLRDDKFLKLCRAEGIQLNEYPFNTKDKGLRSLYRYVEQLINENITEASSRFGDEVQRRLQDLDGETSPKWDVRNLGIPYYITRVDYNISFTKISENFRHLVKKYVKRSV